MNSIGWFLKTGDGRSGLQLFEWIWEGCKREMNASLGYTMILRHGESNILAGAAPSLLFGESISL
jgi:hypothetical protein